MKQLQIAVIQPPYYAGEKPDAAVADFLLKQLWAAEEGSLVVLPEYSNAGGLSDPEQILAAVPRAEEMLRQAAAAAKQKKLYVSMNVLERRSGALKNSTYLFAPTGEKVFVYDKQHLPPSEVKLGIQPGNETGKCRCVCDVDGIRFAFMTCYDVYYNEQIEFIAGHKPDIIIVPGYQRGERTDIIRAQAKLMAFRCNAFVARSSFSMDSDERGGCSMIVSPDGEILQDLGKAVGAIWEKIDPKFKYMRSAGFGGGLVRNDEFIENGKCPQAFTE